MTIIIVCIFIVVFLIFLIIKYNPLKMNNNYLEELEIGKKQLIAGDDKLIEILYNIRGINLYINKFYNKLYELLEDFYVTHRTLLLNVNNIYLKPNEFVKPFKLNIVHRNMLKNDLRDQLERILKHIEEMIHTIPSQQLYLNAFSNFNKLINEHLSKMYSQIDKIPEYQINRKNENYDFLY